MTFDERNGESFIYEVSAGESLSEGVVEAVAAGAGVRAFPEVGLDPEASLEPLYTVVDPDALDALFDRPGQRDERPFATVTFQYHGYEVTARSDGRIALTRVEPAAGATPN